MKKKSLKKKKISKSATSIKINAFSPNKKLKKRKKKYFKKADCSKKEEK